MSATRAFSGNELSSLFHLLDDYNDHITTKNSGLTARSFHPRFDIRETNDAYFLDGELPGIEQKDIDLEFTDPHTLVVKGATQREYAPKEGEGPLAKGRYWSTERSIGHFSRTFSFPVRTDQDRVKASLKHGILSVYVPKGTSPTSRRIAVD